MGDVLTFDSATRPTRKRGSAERAVVEALHSWRPHLVGPEHAGTRMVLRTAAKNLDRAVAAAESPYVVGQLTRWLNELLTLHAPAATDEDDLPPDPDA